jgi:hypothetical protein
MVGKATGLLIGEIRGKGVFAVCKIIIQCKNLKKKLYYDKMLYTAITNNWNSTRGGFGNGSDNGSYAGVCH